MTTRFRTPLLKILLTPLKIIIKKIIKASKRCIKADEVKWWERNSRISSCWSWDLQQIKVLYFSQINRNCIMHTEVSIKNWMHSRRSRYKTWCVQNVASQASHAFHVALPTSVLTIYLIHTSVYPRVINWCTHALHLCMQMKQLKYTRVCIK